MTKNLWFWAAILITGFFANIPSAVAEDAFIFQGQSLDYGGDKLADAVYYDASRSRIRIELTSASDNLDAYRLGAGNVRRTGSTVEFNFGPGIIYGGDPRLVILDYDGDHRGDICVFDRKFATWYILQSTAGPKVVRFGRGTLSGGKPNSLSLRDYDGDGRHDLVILDGALFIQFAQSGSSQTVYFQHRIISRPNARDGFDWGFSEMGGRVHVFQLTSSGELISSTYANKCDVYANHLEIVNNRIYAWRYFYRTRYCQFAAAQGIVCDPNLPLRPVPVERPAVCGEEELAELISEYSLANSALSQMPYN